VAPGLVTTESNLAQMKPESTERWAQLADVVRVAVWLATDASAGITGQVIAVMGFGI
jgi:NAD(P)-dependent dehydrogenase (short-subunit alcohol dehydrogenase family)